MAVGIACLGVFIMTYGDSGSENEPLLAGSEGDLPGGTVAEDRGQVGTLFGDLLALFASFLVAFYEVSGVPNGHYALGQSLSILRGIKL